jgi:hypothetical protein
MVGERSFPQQNGEHGRDCPNASRGRVEDWLEQARCLYIIISCALWGACRVIYALLGGLQKTWRVVYKIARALWGGVYKIIVVFCGPRADLSATDLAEAPLLGSLSSPGATTKVSSPGATTGHVGRAVGWNPSSTMDLVREIVARDQQRCTIMMMGLPEVGPPHTNPVEVIDAELKRAM